MKQVFHPYEKWEGFKSGMYEPCKENRLERVKDAEWLLSRPNELYKAMVRVTNEWKYETEHVLSDPQISHRAWLGQSACNIWGNVKEDETREAWGNLTERQRKKANEAADKAELEWRYVNDDEVGYQLSFLEIEGGF